MYVYLFNSIYISSFILYLLGTMVPFPVHLPLHPSNERSVYLRALIAERAQDSGSTSLESTQQKWLDNQLGFNTICGLDLSAWGSSKTGADPKLLCICITIIISYNMLWYLMSTYIFWYFIIMMPPFLDQPWRSLNFFRVAPGDGLEFPGNRPAEPKVTGGKWAARGI